MLCGTNEFQCSDKGNCISNDMVCDGLPDCDDESEEINCGGGRVVVLLCNLLGIVLKSDEQTQVSKCV